MNESYTDDLEKQYDEQHLELAKCQAQVERLNAYICHQQEQHRNYSDAIKHIVQSLHAYQYDPERTARIIADLCRVVGIDTKPNWIPPQFLSPSQPIPKNQESR
jgi:peptidoglycan hydrolase CwlO-like protein